MTSSQDSEFRNQVLKEWGLATLFFAVLLAIFFYPAVFQGKLLYSGDRNGSDLLDFNIPRRHAVTQAMRDGEFPLWEPSIGAGCTVQAEGHPGIFYPLNTPINLLCSITTAANFSAFFALYVAFLGCYWLARLYKLSPGSALLGATAYTFGGTFIFRLRQLNIINAIAWAPASLACIRLYLDNGQRRWLVGIGITWTLQVLAGHPQIAYINQILFWLYIAAVLLGKRPFILSATAKTIGLLVLTGLVALSLSCVQWLPTYEMTKLTVRSSKISDKDLNAMSFSSEMVPCLVKPYALGNPADQKDKPRPLMFQDARPYWGLIPLLLALAALGKRTRREALPLYCLALLCLWLSFGPDGKLYKVLMGICPGFNLFRFPCRFGIPLGLLVAILSAMGLDNIAEYGRNKLPSWALKASLVTVLALTTLDLYLVNDKFQDYLPSDWAKPPITLEAIGPQHQRIFSPVHTFHWMWTVGSLGWKDRMDLVQALLCELPIDLSSIWGVQSPVDQAFFGGGLTDRGHSQLMTFIMDNIIHEDETTPERRMRIHDRAFTMIRLLSVSHIVSLSPIVADGNPNVTKTTTIHPPTRPKATLYIYELSNPLPEMRLVPELVRDVPELLTITPKAMRGTIEPYNLFEPDLEHPQSVGRCTVTAQTRNTLSLTTEYEKPSYLILSRTYHPNWKASIDGAPFQPLFCVNVAFQGLQLPAGRHEVRLEYSSPAFSLAWKVSLGTLILVCLGLFWGYKRHKLH